MNTGKTRPAGVEAEDHSRVVHVGDYNLAPKIDARGEPLYCFHRGDGFKCGDVKMQLVRAPPSSKLPTLTMPSPTVDPACVSVNVH